MVKAVESLTETVVDILLQSLPEYFSAEEARRLFENSDGAASIIEFFNSADTINELFAEDIGEKFSPMSIIVIPDHKFMSIAEFPEEAELVEIFDDRYVFRLHGVRQIFPQPDKENPLVNRLVFQSAKDANDFKLLLKLRFSTWRIVSKLL